MCQVEDACIICATFPTTGLHFPVCICWSSLFMANCSLSYWSARLFPCLLLFPMLHFLILITTCLNPKPTFPTKARLVEILTIFLTLITINPLLPPTLSHPSPHICSRDMLHPLPKRTLKGLCSYSWRNRIGEGAPSWSDYKDGLSTTSSWN